MKKLSKSLQINKQTVAFLSGNEMSKIAGGGGDGSQGCDENTTVTQPSDDQNTELHPCSNNCETESWIQQNNACVGQCNLSAEPGECNTWFTEGGYCDTTC